MLQQLITGIDFFRNIIYNVYYYSFKAGQLLIFCIKLLLNLFVLLLKGLNVFLVALSESFSVFSEDIAYGIRQVADFISMIVGEFQKVVNLIMFSTQTVFEAFVLLHTVIGSTITNLQNLIVQVPIQFKRLVVLFGSGMWFILTLMPLGIYNFGLYLLHFILSLFEEAGAFVMHSIKKFKLSIREFYDFVTDVPVESVIGLIVLLSLIYILIQFHMAIFACIDYQLYKLLVKLRRFMNSARYFRLPSFNFNLRRNNRPFTQVGTIRLSPKNKHTLNNSNDDRYCIICQERLKCILLLPCKHLCMCSECNVRLQIYDDSCPICRIVIEDSMRVFV